MERVGTVLQQKPDDPGDPALRDNLYEPRVDSLRGTQDVHARPSSAVLQVWKIRPTVPLVGILGVGIAVSITRLGRRRV